jgi:hypothetical protein
VTLVVHLSAECWCRGQAHPRSVVALVCMSSMSAELGVRPVNSRAVRRTAASSRSSESITRGHARAERRSVRAEGTSPFRREHTAVFRRERDGLGRGDDLGDRYGPSGVPGVSGDGGEGNTGAHGTHLETHTHCCGAGAGGGGGGSSSASAAGEPTRAPMAAVVANATKRRRMRLMANSNLLMMRRS